MTGGFLRFNFTTDKLEHYRKGFKKYFWNVATLTHGVPIKCGKYGLKRNNNYIDVQKLFAEKNWRTPAERAKIKLDLGNRFQLLNLIKKAYAED